MKKYRIKIVIDREVNAMDDEDAAWKFFVDIENNNETLENIVAENMIILEETENGNM